MSKLIKSLSLPAMIFLTLWYTGGINFHSIYGIILIIVIIAMIFGAVLVYYKDLKKDNQSD